jgi:hypothetical protein
MMKQQPDKLFSDKLASYSRPAPARSWDAIEARLDKRSRKGLWLKLAASLLLLAAATYVLWEVYGSRKQAPGRDLAGTRPAVQQVTPADRIAPQGADSTAPVLQKAAAEASPLADGSRRPVARQKTPRAEAERAPASAQPIADETTVAIAGDKDPAQATGALPDAAKDPAVATETPVADAYASAAAPNTLAEDKTITLIYSAHEADGYLDKKGLAEATSADEKPSTLKKLLKKAADLKSNQDPLGELRQRKNEILALNFRSEKQRGQNK